MSAGDVRADQVALHCVAGGVGPDEADAAGVVAGNKVAIGRCGASDHVIGAVADKDPKFIVGGSRGAGGVGADEVARNDITAILLQDDAAASEVSDHQPAHCTVAGGDREAARNRDSGYAGTVERDLQHRIVALGQRVRARARLAVAVDDYRIGDGWQSRLRRDRVHSRA